MHYTKPEVYRFISKQTNDSIVEQKTCQISGEEFAVFQSDLDFYNKISPTFNGIKYQIPTPNLCPEERQRLRLTFRNERKLYRRKCDFSGESIISMISPDKEYKVYSQDSRRSDKRSPLDYGRDFDFTKTFAEQFRDLQKDVPKISLMAGFNENCSYVNACGHSKSCYLIFDSDFCEDSMYSSIIKHSKNVLDSTNIYFCENIYNSINCTESFDLLSCYECNSSRFLSNCSKCTNCEFCYNCSNLVNKKYCINNQQYTESEYKEKTKILDFSYKYPSSILRSQYTINDEAGVGNNLYETKNCVFCHNIGKAENMRHCDLVTGADNCIDVSSFGENIQWCYDSTSIGVNSSNILFTYLAAADTSNLLYCDSLMNGCKNCFACTNMHGNKEYCILNKQYTKEEYEKLVPKIIEHMQKTGERGSFLAPELSLFSYNETVAQDYFPLTREEALKRGYARQDKNYDPKIPEGIETLKGDQIPSDILQVTDDIFTKIFICEESGRPFKIIKQELDFYKKHNIPLPRKHSDIRHLERFKKKPKQELYIHICDKCNKETLSVNKDKNGNIEYCEDCYNREIYG